MAHGAVACSECLHDANHAGAFEDDDEQSANHCEARHSNHKSKDYPHVEVEKVEPRKDVGHAVDDGLRAVCGAVVVDGPVDVVDDAVLDGVELAEVVDEELGSRRLVVLPAVESYCGVEVGEYQRLVEVGEVSLVDAGDGEAACTDVARRDEVGKDLVASLQEQLVGDIFGDDELLPLFSAKRCTWRTPSVLRSTFIMESFMTIGYWSSDCIAMKLATVI